VTRLVLLGLVLASIVQAHAAPVVLDEVVVTADRVEQRRGTVPAHVTVLGADELERSASLTLDDALRRVPGLSLFRRTSSLVAHPTTQGVSLRGLGASGASRTLVLLDGVPLNDPFGGWIPWSKVPLESLERVEVVRGPSATAWGNYALGGVVHLVTKRPLAPALQVTGEGGTRGTARTDGRATAATGRVGVGLAANHLDTDGYPVVREDQRGPIDIPAFSRHTLVDGALSWVPSPDLDLRLHANAFTEARGNGTPLTDNATDALDLDTRLGARSPDGSDWTLLAFSRLQEFESRFSAQAADRRSERPATDQFDVPSTSAGASLGWTRPLAAHRLAAGVDGLHVDAESNEDVRFMRGAFTRRRLAGMRQRFLGVHGESLLALRAELQATFAGRLDHWQATDGFRREHALPDGAPTLRRQLPDRDELVPTGSVALRYAVTPQSALRGAMHRGFRAPTINELVRPFRVRNDITEANAALRPEQLTGGEVGADHAGERWRASLTGHWTRLEDAIANVTVGAGPGDVAPCGFVPAGGQCRQRRNLDTVRVRGLEADVEVWPVEHWTLGAGYLLTDARVTRGPRALDGRRVAQVPKHQGMVEVAHARPGWPRAAVLVRWAGAQFEDDRNALRLAPFATVDLSVGYRIGKRWELFVGVENLLDRTIEAGKTTDGLVTVGAPRLAHGGVRLRL
jgi:outer membrane receptor protein involved in Fe transport